MAMPIPLARSSGVLVYKRLSLISSVFIVGMLAAACARQPTGMPSQSPPPTTSPAGVFRLLVMDSSDQEPYSTAREALYRNLATFGYVPGENLLITYHSIGNDQDLGRRILLRELDLAYDVIFVNGTAMTTAARDVALGLPQHRFVFACVTDPVGIGVIDGLGKPPQANFTGVSYPVPVASRLRFVRELMPDARLLGMVYAEMEPSISYRRWIEELVAGDPEFQGIEVVFRAVPALIGEKGPEMMAEAARPFIRELDPLVDAFLAPNDQMGVEHDYAEMVAETASKPLVGLGLRDVMDGWGATMSIYASQDIAGQQCAVMIKRLFEGEAVQAIMPEWPAENGYAFDLREMERFGIQVPFEMIVLAGDHIVPREER